MDCVILAGGNGIRLSSVGPEKPLVPVLGVPLIERVVLAGREAGATRFIVVVGPGHDAVVDFLHGLRERRSLDIEVAVNPRPSPDNGWSALQVKGMVSAPFLLLMADHLLSDSVLLDFVAGGLGDQDLVLGVDRHIKDPGVDAEDATKVALDGDRVLAIGKDLQDYHAFDTGMFLCSTAVFDALEEAAAESRPSMTAAVRVLAARDRVRARCIGEGFWVDVDTQDQLRRAERLLVASLPKPTDGPVSRHLNRPLSLRLSARLVTLPVRPTQLSVTSLVVAALGAGLFFWPGYAPLALGGVLVQLASVLDGCDGEVARLKRQATWFGGWLDSVLDRYADALILFALTYHVHLERPGWPTLLAGFLAIVGSFVNTYSAVVFDPVSRRLGEAGSPLRLGRDVRLFIVFVAAVVNAPFAALVILGLLMNLEVVRRAWLLRRVYA